MISSIGGFSTKQIADRRGRAVTRAISAAGATAAGSKREAHAAALAADHRRVGVARRSPRRRARSTSASARA